FDFHYLGEDLAAFALPDLQLISVTPVTRNRNVIWASCLYEDLNYLYVYGSDNFGTLHYAYVARTSYDQLAGPWQYYTGTGWNANPDSAARLKQSDGSKLAVSTMYSVFKDDQGLHLLTQDQLLGPKIYSYDCNQLTGPFSNKTLIYKTPQ